MSAASIGRQTRQLLKGFGAQLGGRERGPDPKVRRDSYDVEDPKAKPWSRIGDGSTRHGLAFGEALLKTAREHYQLGWKEFAGQAIREARAHHIALATELDGYSRHGGAPVGRPAAIRRELVRLSRWLDRAGRRLRRIDLTILQVLIDVVDFATGKLFPSIDTIADRAGCHRNSVIAALQRLKQHGFVAWVRRSMLTGNEGQFAPQREQTSNAYFFDHRRKMAPRTWQRFTQILVQKLRRLGAVPDAVRSEPPAAPPTKDVSELRAAIESLGSKVPNAST